MLPPTLFSAFPSFPLLPTLLPPLSTLWTIIHLLLILTLLLIMRITPASSNPRPIPKIKSPICTRNRTKRLPNLRTALWESQTLNKPRYRNRDANNRISRYPYNKESIEELLSPRSKPRHLHHCSPSHLEDPHPKLQMEQNHKYHPTVNQLYHHHQLPKSQYSDHNGSSHRQHDESTKYLKSVQNDRLPPRYIPHPPQADPEIIHHLHSYHLDISPSSDLPMIPATLKPLRLTQPGKSSADTMDWIYPNNGIDVNGNELIDESYWSSRERGGSRSESRRTKSSGSRRRRLERFGLENDDRAVRRGRVEDRDERGIKALMRVENILNS